MDKIPSFSKNHDTLSVGLHECGTAHGVTTWDLRFKKPNAGDYVSPKASHTIEHIIATLLRNSDKKDNIIYFGPMGCRTGFYLLTVNLNYAEVLKLLKESFALAQTITEVPGNKREECGNYLEHDLADAICECKKYLEILNSL
ncbi:MAG: S-ribosylhomocysteine lyase [Clostridia bacterium]|nr:S-ribosylhomocysteine lyase [Clostridia bacterium]MDE7265764.1 S-ribosylhomocysteine lyase [Clostridia bacterium]